MVNFILNYLLYELRVRSKKKIEQEILKSHILESG